MTPQISIILPFYNAAAYIERAVRSTLAQTGPTLEVLAVDDGSQDDSHERLLRLRDARLKILRLPTNQGVAVARNAGLAAARGEWILFLDADDYLLPGTLDRLHASASDADVVFCDWQEVDETSGRETQCHAWFDPDGDHLMQVLAGNPFPIHTLLVRRDLIQRANGFECDVYHEDWALWVRIAAFGVRFRYQPFAGVVYWKRSGSRSYNRYDIARRDLDYLLSLPQRGLPVTTEQQRGLVRRKQYELALLALLRGRREDAAQWLAKCAPLSGYERVETFLVARPATAWLNGWLPGPRKLRRWGTGLWRWLTARRVQGA